jgi:hypothetical protein
MTQFLIGGGGFRRQSVRFALWTTPEHLCAPEPVS